MNRGGLYLPEGITFGAGEGASSEGAEGDGHADGGGAPAETPIVLRQPGGPGTHWVGVAAGWHGFVDALVAHLSGQGVDVDYDSLCEEYEAFLEEKWRAAD